MNETCDCSEDYGPCEDHAEVLAQREGASTRTADDLVYVFLADVLAIGEARGWIAPNMLGKINADRLRTAEHHWSDDDLWDDNYGVRWLKDQDDRDALYDDQMMAESLLGDLGLSAWWEDGYVISRVTGGPLLDS